ncbi:MAG: alpha/beta hydrolase [Anaerolineaceae bacterium]|nr:alpha/beta hydrolase [Anaerolineaceae bacterium]
MLPFTTRYKQEKQSARRHLQTGSQLYETAAGLVETAIIGKGPAVLISHGSGGGYDMGLWLARLIGGQFYFVAPSRFGYLRTPLPSNPTPEAQADTYAALLDTLNVSSVIIVGLSAGGPSALQFALRYPGRCRGLIMLSAISRSLPPLPPLLKAIYTFMLWSDFIPWLFYAIAPDAVFQANGVSRALLARIKLEPEKMDFLRTLYQTTFPTTLRREGIINDMQRFTILPAYPLERITTPTLVIHAINDPIVPFELGEFSAQTIPGAQFLRLSDGGHFSCVTHQEETTTVMQEFLMRCGT